MYRLVKNRLVIRLPDGACIPLSPGNRDYQDYLEWLEAGNTPLPEHTSDELKATKWEAIKAERDRRTQTGGYKVGTLWFHSDQASRTQQLALVMLGSSLPSVQWKTMSGEFVAMTPTLAQQVFQAAVTSDSANFTVAETHKTGLYASADPANYDFSTGWPQTYQEATA